MEGMDEGRTDHMDPGTAEFETLAHGGEVDGMHEAAKHLRGIHHMLPKSAQPHNAKAHKAVLDELHNSFMGAGSPADGDGGSDMPGSSDPMMASGPATPAAKSGPPQMESKGGEIEAEPGEKKADKKEEAKKKKDHEKHSAGGAIFGKAGEEKASKAKAGENYARGGYVDPGTSEFAMTGNGTARGGGLAKSSASKFTYRGGGCVK